MRQNENGEHMVEHHTHYKELHGYDETVWMTESEHRLLHNRLRNEEKCNIPADELKKIAMAANARTSKGKAIRRKYKTNLQYIDFYENTGKNTRLHERILYNNKTGNVMYHTFFYGTNNHKLPVINIENSMVIT